MREFERWLTLNVKSTSSAYKYSRAINSISKDMIEISVIRKNLYCCSSLLELSFAIDKILQDYSFIEKNRTGHNMYSTALKYFIKYKNETTSFEESLLTKEDEIFHEGQAALKEHIVRERNQELIKKSKQKFRVEHNGKLFCEICGFNFREIYGDLGEDFIEAHHTKPVSEMKDGEKTNINDIVMLCSNCHSMIHRKRPWLTKEHLKDLLK